MINTDVFIEIGGQHKVCEDYIVKEDSPFPFIILSDGCSNSEDTDMGSRILCHLAKQYMKKQTVAEPLDYKKTGEWIIYNAEMTATQLGLDKTCLDATLTIAYCDIPRDTICVMMYGDGSIIRKGKSGEIHVMTTTFQPKNAPYYLSYRIDSQRDKLYHELKNENHLTLLSSSDNYQQKYIDSYAYDIENVAFFSTKELDLLLICSDGIDSFLNNDGTELQSHDLFDKFTNIKTSKGAFLQRTIKRSLRNLNREGITHYDDLSIGAFLFNEE